MNFKWFILSSAVALLACCYIPLALLIFQGPEEAVCALSLILLWQYDVYTRKHQHRAVQNRVHLAYAIGVWIFMVAAEYYAPTGFNINMLTYVAFATLVCTRLSLWSYPPQ